MAATTPLDEINEKLIYTFRVPERDCAGLSAFDSNHTGWSSPRARDLKLPRFEIAPQPGFTDITSLPPLIGVKTPYPTSRVTWELEGIDARGSTDVQQKPDPIEFIITGGMGCIQDAWSPILLFTPVGFKGQFLAQGEGRLANQFEIRARVAALQVGTPIAWTYKLRCMIDRADTSTTTIILQRGPNVV